MPPRFWEFEDEEVESELEDDKGDERCVNPNEVDKEEGEALCNPNLFRLPLDIAFPLLPLLPPNCPSVATAEVGVTTEEEESNEEEEEEKEDGENLRRLLLEEEEEFLITFPKLLNDLKEDDLVIDGWLAFDGVSFSSLLFIDAEGDSSSSVLAPPPYPAFVRLSLDNLLAAAVLRRDAILTALPSALLP